MPTPHRRGLIHDVYEAELRLVQAESALLLQRRSGGFSGELSTSGAIVENFVANLLRKHLPDGYGICSGYVATPSTMDGDPNLAQHDVIIYDRRFPPIHRFGASGITVLAAESVCGLIEVKRTLTNSSLQAALGQLRATRSILEQYRSGLKSKTRSPLVPGSTMPQSVATPLYGVVSLDASADDLTRTFVDDMVVPAIRDFVDVVWAPTAAVLATYVIRTGDSKIMFPPTVARRHPDSFLPGHENDCLLQWFEYGDATRIYALAISMFRTWIGATSGVPMDLWGAGRYFGIGESP